MKKLTQKDIKLRNLASNSELKKVILKSIIRTSNLPEKVKQNAQYFLNNVGQSGSDVKINKLCIVTKRKNKTNKQYNLSRSTFLKFAQNGKIGGLTKSSW